MSPDQIEADMPINAIVEKCKFFNSIFGGAFTNKFFFSLNIKYSFEPIEHDFDQKIQIHRYRPLRIGPFRVPTKNDEKWRKMAQNPKILDFMSSYDKNNRKSCLERISNFFGIF